MATVTLPDDAIAEARAKLEQLEANLRGKRDAAAAAQSEIDQLQARIPERGINHLPKREQDPWYRANAAAEGALANSQVGLRDLQRLIAEQERWLAELQRRRVPKYDDAIAEARARLARIPDELNALAADVGTLEARIRGYDAAQAVDDALPDGEPARANAALEGAKAGIAKLEAERTRLDLRVATLIERRQAWVVELVEGDRHVLEARWAGLADEALAAAVRLLTVARELEQLEEEYRVIGPRHGLPAGRMPTVGDQRWAPEQLERSIVALARGLALRSRVGRAMVGQRV